MTSPAASAAVLSNWSFDPAVQQLAITLPKGITPRFLVFAEPTRIVLEVPNTQMGPMVTKQSYLGAVQAVEVNQHDANTVRISLVLAPGTVIDRRHADLVATEVGSQTQWTLTPLLVGNTPPIASEPQPTLASPQASLPPLPTASSPTSGSTVSSPEAASADETTPDPQFVETPEGQLSISASNLLPPTGDQVTELPATLPMDPSFPASSSPSAQVSVPSLEETIPASSPSQVGSSGLDKMPAVPLAVESANAATSQIAVPNPPEADLPETGVAANASDPPFLETVGSAIASQPTAPTVTSAPAAPAVPEGAITVGPPASEGSTPMGVPTVEPPSVETPFEEPPFIEVPLESASGAVIPPAAPAQASLESPPFLDAPANASLETFSDPAIAPQSAPASTASSPAEPEPFPLEEKPPALVQPSASAPAAIAAEPPAIASPPLALSNPLDSLPPAISPTKPAAEPVPFLSSAPPARPSARSNPENSISFGQPLPATAGKEETVPTFPYIAPPDSRTQPALDPGVLIPKGTLLQLRYPGAQPLQLDQTSAVEAALILVSDLVDARTGVVIAPAGSQLVGQFKPDEMGQRWVGQALLLPGRQVPLSGASAYFAGSPQLSGQNLALTSGIGALALTVLTGFTGVGLLGGAVLGATTAMGVAPQAVVVEPNQIIEVQILEDVPRSSLQM
ncbi:MAG TPA: AMIN domain-containing protein [Trichocoleus sp.]